MRARGTPTTMLLATSLLGGCLYNASLYDERRSDLTDAEEDALCQADADGDGFGGVATVASDDLDCDDEGESTGTDDCDDADGSAHPGATEVWYDGLDQDCLDNEYDADGDGFASDEFGGDDCDDADSKLHPGLNREFQLPGTFASLQAAIDASCDGDTILLEEGVDYLEDLDFGPHAVMVVGRWPQAIIGVSDGPTVTLRGGGLADVQVYGSELGTQGCVRVDGGQDVRFTNVHFKECRSSGNGGALSVVDTDGITLFGGFIGGNAAAGNGGGLYVENSSRVALAEMWIVSNEAGGAGGAVYVSDSTELDVGFTLYDNNRSNGLGSSVAITGNSTGDLTDLAVANSLGEGQAALYLQGHVNVANMFAMHSEGAGAHVLPNPGDDVRLTNLLLIGNAASGLVVDTSQTDQVTVNNAIVAYNGGYGVLSLGSADPDITYSDVFGNQSAAFSGMSDLTGIDGNLAVSPGLLQYPSTLGLSEVALLLRPDSPLRDAGDPALRDPDNSRSDIGMFGGPEAVLFEGYADLDADGMYDGYEANYGLDTARNDAAEDPDSDGLSNGAEFINGLSPISADTDEDGIGDFAELTAGTDPLDNTDH